MAERPTPTPPETRFDQLRDFRNDPDLPEDHLTNLEGEMRERVMSRLNERQRLTEDERAFLVEDLANNRYESALGKLAFSRQGFKNAQQALRRLDVDAVEIRTQQDTPDGPKERTQLIEREDEGWSRLPNWAKRMVTQAGVSAGITAAGLAIGGLLTGPVGWAALTTATAAWGGGLAGSGIVELFRHRHLQKDKKSERSLAYRSAETLFQNIEDATRLAKGLNQETDPVKRADIIEQVIDAMNTNQSDVLKRYNRLDKTYGVARIIGSVVGAGAAGWAAQQAVIHNELAGALRGPESKLTLDPIDLNGDGVEHTIRQFEDGYHYQLNANDLARGNELHNVQGYEFNVIDTSGQPITTPTGLPTEPIYHAGQLDPTIINQIITAPVWDETWRALVLAVGAQGVTTLGQEIVGRLRNRPDISPKQAERTFQRMRQLGIAPRGEGRPPEREEDEDDERTIRLAEGVAVPSTSLVFEVTPANERSVIPFPYTRVDASGTTRTAWRMPSISPFSRYGVESELAAASPEERDAILQRLYDAYERHKQAYPGQPFAVTIEPDRAFTNARRDGKLYYNIMHPEPPEVAPAGVSIPTTPPEPTTPPTAPEPEPPTAPPVRPAVPLGAPPGVPTEISEYPEEGEAIPPPGDELTPPERRRREAIEEPGVIAVDEEGRKTYDNLQTAIDKREEELRDAEDLRTTLQHQEEELREVEPPHLDTTPPTEELRGVTPETFTIPSQAIYEAAPPAYLDSVAQEIANRHLDLGDFDPTLQADRLLVSALAAEGLSPEQVVAALERHTAGLSGLREDAARAVNPTQNFPSEPTGDFSPEGPERINTDFEQIKEWAHLAAEEIKAAEPAATQEPVETSVQEPETPPAPPTREASIETRLADVAREASSRPVTLDPAITDLSPEERDQFITEAGPILSGLIDNLDPEIRDKPINISPAAFELLQSILDRGKPPAEREAALRTLEDRIRTAVGGVAQPSTTAPPAEPQPPAIDETPEPAATEEPAQRAPEQQQTEKRLTEDQSPEERLSDYQEGVRETAKAYPTIGEDDRILAHLLAEQGLQRDLGALLTLKNRLRRTRVHLESATEEADQPALTLFNQAVARFQNSRLSPEERVNAYNDLREIVIKVIPEAIDQTNDYTSLEAQERSPSQAEAGEQREIQPGEWVKFRIFSMELSGRVRRITDQYVVVDVENTAIPYSVNVDRDDPTLQLLTDAEVDELQVQPKLTEDLKAEDDEGRVREIEE